MEKINVFIKSLVVCVAVGLGACTNYQYIDTGLANGKHDCTVWEYLHSQPDDWDSTILLIAVSYTHLTLPTICSV